MRRILLVLSVALVIAAMVAMALPTFAAAQTVPGCKSHSIESKCGQEFIGAPPPQLNFGDLQSFVATQEGKAAGETKSFNPSLNTGTSSIIFCGLEPGGPPCPEI